MTGRADGKRRYRSPRRAQQAADTRAAVLDAASALFSSRGWSATSVREIAGAAGVSVETVYATYGSKITLLLAAVDAGVVGDLDPVALADRPEFTALGSGSISDRIAAGARLMATIYRRTAGLYLALREAAATDREAAARLADLEQRQRDDFARGLHLAIGRTVDERELEGLWAVGSVEVYRLLTGSCGWSDEQYEAWLADVLVRLLPELDA